MVFTFLLVATMLTVSINQRLGEIAALRALGIGRPRIAAMLLWESALMVGGGGLLALPLGGLLALGLDRILKQMPGVPERLHFFVFEPRALCHASRAAVGHRRRRGRLSDLADRASADRGHAAARGGGMMPLRSSRPGTSAACFRCRPVR